MATFRPHPSSSIQMLIHGWECLKVPADSADSPAQIASISGWLPAKVPGTFAAALRDADMWDGTSPLELDHADIWYRVQFSGGGEETLCFAGLATIAEIWLNGKLELRSTNMFLPMEITVRTETSNELYICFRSLTTWLQGHRGRARWRTLLASPANLRFARTTLLGRMPGWCPSIHPVGPWRPVMRRLHDDRFNLRSLIAQTSIEDGDGKLVLRCEIEGDMPPHIEAVAELGGSFVRLGRLEQHTLAGELLIRNVSRWWPHTHGTPHLYTARLRVGDQLYDLRRIGFRDIEADHGEHACGFGLRINGERIFCRGACWTTPNIIDLPGDAAGYRPWLEAARDAGMNMIRVGGTMVYESDDFYALCDELGILVWQDAMLANFDYPVTPEFRSSLIEELQYFLSRTQTNACMAVLCGGSEVLQQAAMFGLASDQVDASLYAEVIPEIVQRLRPDVPYVINSPSGGEWSFLPDIGVAHYYGVGAYQRPLDDARRTRVRFASECLALANVPCDHTVAEMHVTTTADPRWKQAVPRDQGAGWDFEDVRDHYLEQLFGIEARSLRSRDFTRYLDISRAVSCILIEHVFSEWRSVNSSCQGGLIWQLQDVSPGAGWGVIDACGRRKSAWYALQRILQPVQLIVTDEGLNGLTWHIVNETAVPLRAVLRVVCLKGGITPVRQAEQMLTVGPRSAICLRSATLLLAFFDITYAYRFGPCPHDVTVATLHDVVNDTLLAQTCHFPNGYLLPSRNLDLEATVECCKGTWWLRLHSRYFAQFLHIEDTAFMASENWFHLPPNTERRIALLSCADKSVVPDGEVRALNMDRAVRYSGRA